MSSVIWNPTTKGTDVILSNGDLTASHYWSYQSVKTNEAKSKGKWYLELKIETYYNFTMIGIVDDSVATLNNTVRIHSSFYGITRSTDTILNVYNGATIIGTGNGYLALGSIVGILLDMDLGVIDFYINGSHVVTIPNIKLNIQNANIVMTAQSSIDSIKPKVTANFGASDFLYIPSNLPSGVKSYDGTQSVSPFNKSLILHDGEYKSREEETMATPAHWQTVSTSLPTSTQFIEQGMDNLSPLLDRKVTELEPMPMTDKSEILGEGEVGKVFSKTIDLKKYFDIRSIRGEMKWQ